MAYKLQLPESSQIHPVFHVSLLKAKLGEKEKFLPNLPATDDEGNLLSIPLRVLASRQKQKGRRKYTEVLIQWQGQTPADASWEKLCKIKTAYPELDLEVKVDFERGSSCNESKKTHTEIPTAESKETHTEITTATDTPRTAEIEEEEGEEYKKEEEKPSEQLKVYTRRKPSNRHQPSAISTEEHQITPAQPKGLGLAAVKTSTTEGLRVFYSRNPGRRLVEESEAR